MPNNPYTSQSISGYNSAPPSDDGAKTAANQITWAKHKTKLADPIKTLVEAVNSAVSAAFAKTVNTDSSEINSIAGSLAFPNASLTATSGVITPVRTNHTITMTNSATTVSTIVPTSVTEGTLLELRAATGKTITLKHATTTATAGGMFLRRGGDTILHENFPTVLQNRSGTWQEIAGYAGTINSQMTFVTTTGSSTATNIGFDDTTPLATEGTRFVNVSYTPRQTGTILDISAKVLLSTLATSTEVLLGSMFLGTGTATAGKAAIAAEANRHNGAATPMMLRYVATSTATNALNIECNFGPNIDILLFNQASGSALFGTARNSYVLVREILP